MDIKSMLQNAKAELEAEKLDAMSEEERKLHATAKRLLLLERDLKASGISSTTEKRIERLLDALSKEDC